MARKEELQDDTRGMTTTEIERTARRTTKWHARRNYETTRKEGLQRGIDEELQNDTQRGTANAMDGGGDLTKLHARRDKTLNRTTTWHTR